MNMNMKLFNQSRKKSPEELQEYLKFLQRGAKAQASMKKRGYCRKQKHKEISF